MTSTRVAPAPARILVPLLSEASFIRQDIAILGERYDVQRVYVRSLGGLWRAIHVLLSADLLFCWFGSIRFLPLVVIAKLLRIPVVVVTGGYDVASELRIGYGNMRGGWTRRLGRLLFKLADRVLPYSRAAATEATVNAGVDESRLRLIYLGFDDAASAAASSATKERIVLAVGGIDSSTIMRKGFLTVARASALLSEVPFVFAGSSAPEALSRLKAAAGPNAEFLGFVTDDVLATLYRRAAVVVQPSVHEAFGCAVAEAMLWECIPIVSDRGSLPEVVGPTGVTVPGDDPPALATAIERVLARPEEMRGMRQRIIDHFPLARRRDELLAEIAHLLDSRSPRRSVP